MPPSRPGTRKIADRGSYSAVDNGTPHCSTHEANRAGLGVQTVDWGVVRILSSIEQQESCLMCGMAVHPLSGWRLRTVAWLIELPVVGRLIARQGVEHLEQPLARPAGETLPPPLYAPREPRR